MLAKYGAQRGNKGNKLGDMHFSHFAKLWDAHGETVREAAGITPAPRRARELVHSHGKSAVVNVWVDPDKSAPGTKAQTIHK